MSSAERSLFIQTYKTVSSPGPQYAQYQTLLARHATSFGTIHTSQWFLPWHRWFLMEMEDLLQNVNCKVTLPWWDTSKNAGAPWGVSPWGAAADLLGTSGACVTNGGFASPGWPNNAHGCLSRSMSGTLPTAIQQGNVLALPASNYVAFSDALETQIHNLVHVGVGGTMLQGWSPEAPEFFLHHGNTDKLWNDWQLKSNAHLTAYSFSSSSVMPVAMGATPGQFNNLKSTGVMYVRSSASTLGAGHLVLASCILIKLPSVSIDLTVLQSAMWRVNATVLRRIPQLAAPILTTAQENMIEMVRKGRGTSQNIEAFRRRLAAGREALTKSNEALKAAGTLRTSFDSPQSKALGFDVVEAVKLLRIPAANSNGSPALTQTAKPIQTRVAPTTRSVARPTPASISRVSPTVSRTSSSLLTSVRRG